MFEIVMGILERRLLQKTGNFLACFPLTSSQSSQALFVSLLGTYLLLGFEDSGFSFQARCGLETIATNDLKKRGFHARYIVNSGLYKYSQGSIYMLLNSDVVLL